MSEQITLARPYADAVFALATDHDQLARWSSTLALLAAVASDPQVIALSQDPRVTRDHLVRLFLELGGGEGGGDVENLLRLLKHNNRIALLPEIARQFEQLKAEAQGSIDAEVVSAFEVEPAQMKSISDALHRKLGRDIHLTSRVDRSLIGGIVIRAGDLVIDGSVRGRLRSLAAQLTS